MTDAPSSDRSHATIIESPEGLGDFLFHRLDGEKVPINLNASLTVCDDECAVIVVDNKILEVLQTGIYRLDRRQLPELESLFSWPVDYSGPLNADILYVSTAPQPRRLWRCTPQDPGKPDKDFRIDASGTVEFQIVDCRRFARTVIDRGWRDLDDLLREMRRAIALELTPRRSDAEREPGAADPEPRDAAKKLNRTLGARYRDFGIADLLLTVRDLSVRSKPSRISPPSAPEESASTMDNNVTRLPVADHNEKPTASPDREETFDHDGTDAISSIEREIARLDAWSSIAGKATETEHADDSVRRTMRGHSGLDSGSNTDSVLPERLREVRFYIAVDMQQTGPFDAHEFEQAIQEGVVRQDTLIWFAELDDWTRAGDVEGIAQLLRF